MDKQGLPLYKSWIKYDIETAAELSHMFLDLKSTVAHPSRLSPKPDAKKEATEK